MRVGVGSGNPVKRRAVERVLESSGTDLVDDSPGDTTTVAVESVPVPSGVSEQPTGHAETVAGAENRAAAVLDAGAYDLGVGIEGGVARFDGADGLFLVMWAAVADGSEVGRGAGPSLELPADVAARIDEGAELGPVMDDVLDTTGVARRGGAAGALTGGRVDRADALATAVAGALGPFVSDLY
ncbi:inosine/xanthosine triphosphatase [Halorubrum sp. AD140]|uniref:inosine/xanthosine triphosphatase n=1 Tax=Halorubrum sp. AD140 TaxID=3050073 RepID=UPI002ACC6815|nr:inosine/xanthosine triphosphatase [Halorubrum sp. AD140]MDZ5812865.1 inosine/xanthosine triphosphatase [Halorubrum sp. AD140]